MFKRPCKANLAVHIFMAFFSYRLDPRHLVVKELESKCSKDCEGGVEQRTRSIIRKRVRKVDIPIRGGGKCPRPTSRHRDEWQYRNTHECVGDEICIAVQDLVIIVDGSASVNTENWARVRTSMVRCRSDTRPSTMALQQCRFC